MNYRHAFHAGNFADCFKHALLVWLLRALQRKPAPFAVLDTHAGAGQYDLATGPAERTGEWRAGIARLLQDPPAPLADYVALVQSAGLYPGSPVLARALLRPGDRLSCCELHPDDAATLRARFRADPAVSVHARDGYAALDALLPPRGAKRGLVLIDPPFEQPGEHGRLAAALATVAARFPTGIAAAWYPIKHYGPVRTLHETVRLSGPRNVVAAELLLRDPSDPTRLNGNGLLVRNPPFRWDTEWPPLLQALLDRIGEGAPGALVRTERLTAE